LARYAIGIDENRAACRQHGSHRAFTRSNTARQSDQHVPALPTEMMCVSEKPHHAHHHEQKSGQIKTSHGCMRLPENRKPTNIPMLKKTALMPTSIRTDGTGGRPISAAPSPAPNESNESAAPKRTASVDEMEPDRSTSAANGVFQI
jgi:hypothetical protein